MATGRHEHTHAHTQRERASERERERGRERERERERERDRQRQRDREKGKGVQATELVLPTMMRVEREGVETAAAVVDEEDEEEDEEECAEVLRPAQAWQTQDRSVRVRRSRMKTPTETYPRFFAFSAQPPPPLILRGAYIIHNVKHTGKINSKGLGTGCTT